jgi:hypothetical protein
MTNIDPFDVGTAPLGEPLSVVIGSSAQWRREITIDAALFILTYQLRPQDTSIVLPASQDMTMVSVSHGVFAIDADATAFTGWVAGRYFWDLVVMQVSDSRTKIIESGEIFVFDTLGDRRSHAEVMVSKIEGLLQNRADNDVESYTIKARSITKMSVGDLRAWRDYYLREISNQSTQVGMFKKAGPNKSTIRVRFKD